MKQMTKSRDSKSNKSFNSHVNIDKFFMLYDYMQELDAACVAILHHDASTDWYIEKQTSEMINEIEDIQRRVLVQMMAMNVNLKIKDDKIDSYLAHKTYVLGM